MLQFVVQSPMKPLPLAQHISAVGWSIAFAMTIVYAVAVGAWGPLAMQDLPNHVARAAAIDDLVLRGGHGAGAPFEFHFLAVPYVMHDLLLAGCVELFGAEWAGKVWSAFVLLALPFAMVGYARVKGVRGGDLPILFMIGLYLANLASFWKGFLAYCLALPVIVLTLAAADLWRTRASWPRFAAYLSLVVFGYLTHLTATLFAGAALGLTSALRLWRREFRLKRELPLFVPMVFAGLWHLLGHSIPVIAQQGTPQWRNLFEKLRFTAWGFVRFDLIADVALVCLAVVCLVAVVAQRAPSVEGKAYRIEMLLLAGMFAAIYAVLPHSIGILSWLDMRAMPMLAVFLVFACFTPRTAPDLSTIPHRPWGGSTRVLALPLVLATVLSAANLFELGLHARKDEKWLADYRAVAATIPRGAWVLPIYTDTEKGSVRSKLHAGAYTLLEAGAPMPYFFSRNLGDAMVYFSYRELPYAPVQTWYVDPVSEQKAIDWATIAKSYQYLMVSKPFDLSRIPLETSPVRESPSVALLAVKGVKGASN